MADRPNTIMGVESSALTVGKGEPLLTDSDFLEVLKEWVAESWPEAIKDLGWAEVRRSRHTYEIELHVGNSCRKIRSCFNSREELKKDLIEHGPAAFFPRAQDREETLRMIFATLRELVPQKVKKDLGDLLRSNFPNDAKGGATMPMVMEGIRWLKWRICSDLEFPGSLYIGSTTCWTTSGVVVHEDDEQIKAINERLAKTNEEHRGGTRLKERLEKLVDVMERSGEIPVEKNSACPDCGSPAYIGLTTIECSNKSCHRSA